MVDWFWNLGTKVLFFHDIEVLKHYIIYRSGYYSEILCSLTNLHSFWNTLGNTNLVLLESYGRAGPQHNFYWKRKSEVEKEIFYVIELQPPILCRKNSNPSWLRICNVSPPKVSLGRNTRHYFILPLNIVFFLGFNNPEGLHFYKAKFVVWAML